MIAVLSGKHSTLRMLAHTIFDDFLSLRNDVWITWHLQPLFTDTLIKVIRTMILEESVSIKRSIYKGYRFLRHEIFHTLSLPITQEYQQDFNSGFYLFRTT